MHLADGILNIPAIAATTAAAAGMTGYALRNIKEEEIPRISMVTGTCFVLTLISVPVGPSSVHPLLIGLMGILLGRRAPIAILLGLLLQAFLFQHGGFTTLGANTIMLALPAWVSHAIYCKVKRGSILLKGAVIGAVSVIIVLILLVTILMFSQPLFAQGRFSVIRLLIIGHIPLVIIEAFITGFALQLLHKSKPHWIQPILPQTVSKETI